MKTFKQFMDESKKCWPGYKKKGTKKLFGKTYNNCVKENHKNFSKSMIQQEEFIDPETGASPSGRPPIEKVKDPVLDENLNGYPFDEGYEKLPQERMQRRATRTLASGVGNIAAGVGVVAGEQLTGNELGDAPEELAGRFIERGVDRLGRSSTILRTLRKHSPRAAQEKEVGNRNKPSNEKRSRNVPVGFGR